MQATRALGRSVLLVGGLGYVGYNLARLLSQRGVETIIASRRRSAERRPGITRALDALPGVRVEYFDGLGPRGFLERHGCPETAYLLVGRIRGGRRELRASNLEAPLAWASALATRCSDVDVVFTSVLTVYAGRGSLEPEERHGNGLRPRSLFTRVKLEAEKRLLDLCPGLGVRIARLGLFAGRRPYHPEWRLLLRLAGLGVVAKSDAWLHLSTAQGLLEAVDKMRECSWDTVVTRSVTLHALTRVLAEEAVSPRLSLPLPGRRTAKLTARLLPGLLGEAASVAASPPPKRIYGKQGLGEIVAELLAEPPEP